jgi:hypothetical protein
MVGDVDADEGLEGVRVDALVSVADDGLVDVARDHQNQRVGRRLKCLLDDGSIE